MMDKLPKKKLYILLSLVLILLVALLFSLFKQKQNPADIMTEQLFTDSESDTASRQQTRLTSPVMTFSELSGNYSGTAVPNSVKVYNFRTNYSIPYLASVAQKFDLNQNKSEGNTVIFYNTEDPENAGYLKFQTNSGNYELVSYRDYSLPGGAGSEKEFVRNYLLDLGLIDETVECPVTYSRNDINGYIFVECHRDFVKAGLPILNFSGLLNVSNETRLNQLQPGMTDSLTPEQPEIVNTSTGEDGRMRPDDFNTVTVALGGGQGMRITSNLKLIDSELSYGAENLINPDEAYLQMTSGMANLSIIVPDNTENIAWEEIFPENRADNLRAEVTDYILTYLENPASNKMIEPMYVLKGNAVTKSGFNTTFIMAVPALNNRQVFAGEVAGVTEAPALDDESLKLGTFNPDQAGTVTNASPCVPSESQLAPIITLSGYGDVGKFTINNQNQKRANNWFLIPATVEPLPEINAVIAEFDSLVIDEKGSQDEVRELKMLREEWEDFNFCPLRLTGSSPTLFVYGDESREYTLTIGGSLTYAYPEADGNSWKVRIDGAGLKVGRTKVGSIFYEYRQVEFNQPDSGWTSSRKDLDKLAGKIARQTGLNQAETVKLNFELELAASKVNAEKLLVSPIDNRELETKLPLTVSPEVGTARYHFTVTAFVKDLPEPQLKPLVRSSEMVVEVGAVAR